MSDTPASEHSFTLKQAVHRDHECVQPFIEAVIKRYGDGVRSASLTVAHNEMLMLTLEVFVDEDFINEARLDKLVEGLGPRPGVDDGYAR